ncbi:acriflavin resistance protein [Desulfatibacillum aliphaticivorans]|uniref:Acriflavin resistance protein n=1 Tax=Desulfatibacillum aliphaticivorans TaxID=218208 RepID=B8FLF7_DESAL|nr:efflux RND transporter permease subunit [Desulfatibacillum aliphaticivorans]ACL05103.1 acriflavin resistance protein [Desulfatibacillum aliphaticivorans]
MRSIMEAFARNRVFANVILLIILIGGIVAGFRMIKETFPEFSLDMITVEVVYPGADPEEVEEGICRKIEEAIDGVEGIKQYTTYSVENAGTALIEVKENWDVQEVLDKVRSKVDAISTFPGDAEKPVITDLPLKDIVCLLYLSGDLSERGLKEWANDVEDEIKNLPGISQVGVFGAREYEISIEISEERLQEYGLSFDQVAGAVARSNLNLAGGAIRTQGEEIRVRTLGRKYTGKELSEIVVLASENGDIITLDRIAAIRDGFAEDPVEATIDGERAVLVHIFKTSEEDSLGISKTVHKFLEEKQKVLPPGAKIGLLYESTDILKARINLLLKNGLVGLILVLILLFLFLNARLSFWGGMGIPVSMAGALIICWSLGATINMISLFGFILVLGIVVDDAIVVGESIYQHRQNGEGPLEAAVNGVLEVGMPVTAAVITTVVAFIPLMFVGGIMGKFIAILPVVVIACLAISLFECLFLMPAHLSHLPDPNAEDKSRFAPIRVWNAFFKGFSRGLEGFVKRVYMPVLEKALTWRYVSLCIAIAILMLTMGLVAGGLIKFQVFPDIDGFVMTANVELPQGTPPAVTQEAVKRIDDALLRVAERTPTLTGEPMIKSRLSLVGQTLEDIPENGPHLGGVQAIMLESEYRGVHSKDLMVEWEKEIGLMPGVKSLTFTGLSAGPPGAPIEIWLQGKDMNEIIAASEELMEKLATYEGVNQIRSDYAAGKNEMRLELKPEARTLGLTVNDLARQVNSGYYGYEAVRLQRGRDDVRVKVRYTQDERSRLSDFKEMHVRTPDGSEVPLYSVANVSFSPGYSRITRTDGLRRVAVSAGVDSNKANTTEILVDLNRSFFSGLKEKYPGLLVAVQGEQKKMRESFGSLMIGFPAALLGILVIIAIMFRSYLQPLIIMVTVPFGIIGGIFGHLLLGYDLSMMSAFGAVALAGVVVNDAIVLIERINENIAEGMGFREAIIKGGGRRFRAIFLTTLSTVGGLTPLLMETDLQARFLIPMGISLAAGVAFATLLTLLLIPCLLMILNDFRRTVHFFWRGYWPTRREVEPAINRPVQSYALKEECEPAEQESPLPSPLPHEEEPPPLTL